MTDNLSADVTGESTPGSPHSFRFPPAHRLVKAVQYNRVFKRNSRSKDQFFIVLATNNQLPYARLGLAVSRKAAGDAVPRNRLKRLIKESFRLAQPELPKIDCIVMAKPGAAKRDNRTLLTSLNKHWNQVAKLCAK